MNVFTARGANTIGFKDSDPVAGGCRGLNIEPYEGSLPYLTILFLRPYHQTLATYVGIQPIEQATRPLCAFAHRLSSCGKRPHFHL